MPGAISPLQQTPLTGTCPQMPRLRSSDLLVQAHRALVQQQELPDGPLTPRAGAPALHLSMQTQGRLHACALSWRGMLGAHLRNQSSLAVRCVHSVSVGVRQCTVCTVSRSDLGVAGTTQAARCDQAPPAGSRLRHLDRGHPPWVPTSAGAVGSQALWAGFQLRHPGTAHSCCTSQGPLGAQALQQAGCRPRRQQQARSCCTSQQPAGAQAPQQTGVAPCGPSTWSWSTLRQPQMLAACVLNALPQKWPCRRTTVRVWTLLCTRGGWQALCQSTQQPVHLLSQQGNGESLQVHQVQQGMWMPAHWCCMNGVSIATRVRMASQLRVDFALCMSAVLYRVLFHACRDGIACNC